jgi:hypothetical protein
VLLSVTTVVLHLLTPVADRSAALETPEASVGPALAVVGALLLRRATALRLPALLLGIGLSAATYAASSAAAAHTGGDGLLGGLGAWLAAWTWASTFPALAVLLPLLFPDGRLPSRRWRPVLVAGSAVIGAVCLLAASAPGPVAGLEDVVNPVGVEALRVVRGPVEAALPVLLPLLALTGLASLVARWRAADVTARRQVGWFGYGLAVTVVAAFTTSGVLLHLLSLALPAGIAVAVVRWRLYGIDALVDRTLAGAALVGGAAVLYTAVVGWAGAVLGQPRRRPGLRRARWPSRWSSPPRGAASRTAVDRMLHGRRVRPVRPAHGRRRVAAGAAARPRAALQQVTRRCARRCACRPSSSGSTCPAAAPSSSGPALRAPPPARARPCAGTASRSACWPSPPARGRTSSSRATGACSPTWRASWRPWRTPCGSRPTSRPAGGRSSLGWRRSAAACAVTCTTGSARSSPPSRSA